MGRKGFPPGFFPPIFDSSDLSSYDPSSYRCDYQVDFSRQEAITRKLGDQFDDADRMFLLAHWKPECRPIAYEDDFLKCSEQNPLKLYEIGVAWSEKMHAAIIIYDITRTKADEPGLTFEYLAMKTEPPKEYSQGDVRRLHLIGGGDAGHDLEFKTYVPPERFHRYYSICRLRTTDRTIKYSAAISFPLAYKLLTSDCATFAHNFLVTTLERARDDGHAKKELIKSIISNLVSNNHAEEGSAGETEGVSRRNKALGESGGLAVKSYDRLS